LCLALLGAASGAAAAPVACPVDVMGNANCVVSDDFSDLLVRATSNAGGSATVRMATGDVIDLFAQEFEVYSLEDEIFIPLELESATEDDDTSTIRVQFAEATAGAITVIGTFVLTGQGTTSIVDESFTIVSNAPATEQGTGRFYLVTDFDLNQGSEDDAVTASSDGMRIEQVDDGTLGIVEVTGIPPDAFDVAVCCDLSSITDQNLAFELQNRTSALGPADLQSALSWDPTLSGGESVSFTVRKTVTVAEPGASVLGLAALLALRARASRAPAPEL
jgi:hypothetical protein